METARIAELLAPFVGGETLTQKLLEALQCYLDMLLRWNARINLTAVRDPEQIVTRHFGESLFAARILLGEGHDGASGRRLVDVGSGAGFPGLPMKLMTPELEVTMIEAHQKKAVFLREVVRRLELDHAEVFCGRAESWTKTADLVTLRAVEHFEQVLPLAANLVAQNGWLALLVGTQQVFAARKLLGDEWHWLDSTAIPLSGSRILLRGWSVGSRLL